MAARVTLPRFSIGVGRPLRNHAKAPRAPKSGSPLKRTGPASDTRCMGQILSDPTYFSRRLTEEMARSRRSGVRFSVVLLTSQPADGELPEIACDRALPELLESVRQTDCVSRIGPATIAVMLIDASDAASRRAALRLVKQLGDASACWGVRIIEYPEQERILLGLGLAA